MIAMCYLVTHAFLLYPHRPKSILSFYLTIP